MGTGERGKPASCVDTVMDLLKLLVFLQKIAG